MPIIRIEECCNRSLDEKRALLAAAIKAVGDVLGADESELQGRYQRSAADDFVAPEQLGDRYTFIEITLFEGRREETKARLYRRIVDDLRATGLVTHRIDIALDERATTGWAIRDGTMASRAGLPYRIDV